MTTKTPREVMDQATGGSYEMPDGRAFWIDGPVAHEIVRRQLDALTAAGFAIHDTRTHVAMPRDQVNVADAAAFFAAAEERPDADR